MRRWVKKAVLVLLGMMALCCCTGCGASMNSATGGSNKSSAKGSSDTERVERNRGSANGNTLGKNGNRAEKNADDDSVREIEGKKVGQGQ